MHWSQLRTILWLRWRLTRNQWSRGGRLNVIITVDGHVPAVHHRRCRGPRRPAGRHLCTWTKVSPGVILGVWDGTIGAFLVFWIVGILSEIQRSEAIDIGKMLHLPVSLRGIFIVNYVASHVTASIIVFVPWMMGLSVGLAASRGWAMLWLLPLVLGFVFMITAWTYHLRGWLMTLMQNPRRYRAIVGGITLAFILLSQLPNLLMDATRQTQDQPPSQTGAAGNTKGAPDRTLRRTREFSDVAVAAQGGAGAVGGQRRDAPGGRRRLAGGPGHGGHVRPGRAWA